MYVVELLNLQELYKIEKVGGLWVMKNFIVDYDPKNLLFVEN
jgi:hypothetical protein